jgi:hypothetical protein
MFNTLPRTAREVMDWEWAQFAPYYADLEARALDAAAMREAVDLIETVIDELEPA